ncbi:PRC-barrel domain-containing protein [Curtanaerobium respiraculi]|uniref:PRC-barrel domain-containing protein n=1 Tax=Curtanaerobium respiraculi TaxID=2949669 RepID=UPI0024B3A993|nr:PRC-barrel domain-containing protein [Curtanaerobium respiraculi]
MEITESILGRKVVALDDRKAVGSLKEIVVDCAQYRISHYVVEDEEAQVEMALPFNKVIAVGDTYMTIQDAAGLVSCAEMSTPYAVVESFDLLGLKAYSRAGNYLGTVKLYDIDPGTGALARIVLDGGGEYGKGSFVSLSPEFIFVDDGTATDADKRAGRTADAQVGDGGTDAQESSSKDPAENEHEPVAPQLEGSPEQADAPAASESQVEEAAETPVSDAPSGQDVPEDSAAEELVDDEDPDEVLKAYLLGKKINESVSSEDGAFTLASGSEITADVLASAQKADALLLLTMALEDDE